MLARRKGRLKDLARGMVAADELHHDVDLGVAHHVVPVGGEDALVQAKLLGMAGAAGAGLGQAQVDAVGLEVVVVVALQQAYETAADRAQADDADVDDAHMRAPCHSGVVGEMKKARRPSPPGPLSLLG